MNDMTNKVDYVDLYNNLGSRLLEVIDSMKSLERGLRKKKNEDISLGGTNSNAASKIQLRLAILKEEANAITKAIQAIKPMADYERKIKEAEAKNKELEELLKQLEQQQG